jgi:PBSX family phage terminase large subunit
MAQVIRHKLLPKQADFVESQSRELLYSGAYAAGKTRALCYRLVARAQVEGSREGLCRKHLVTLKASTLRTLLESDGQAPPVLPPGTYEHNKSEKVIRIRGGGEIVYFGLDDPQKIGSYNLSGVAVDEAVELDLQDWHMLIGRVRLDVGMHNSVYAVCNPGAPSHWLAKRFGLALDYKCNDDCEVIHTKTGDNVFLPASYIESLTTLTGVAYRRYVEGQWCASDGMVYDHWDRLAHVAERDREQRRYIIGMDAGYRNPTVMLLVGIDGEDRLHVEREWYRTQQLEVEVARKAKEWQEKFDPECFVVDPSALSLIEAMKAEGLHVVAAKNAVFDGIQAVQQRLRSEPEVGPLLTVDPRCENTIREFESYEWMGDKESQADRPRKENDHAMDALRYAVTHVDGLGAGVTLDVFDSNKGEFLRDLELAFGEDDD